MDERAAFRTRLREIGRVKAEGAAEDVAAHLALPLAERVRRVIELSAQTRQLFDRSSGEVEDDEAEVWARVQERLRSRRSP
jgi:hypothetical protein